MNLIERIARHLNQFDLVQKFGGADRVLHFMAGFLIGLAAFFCPPGWQWLPWVAAGIIGALKELYDWRIQGERFDILDLVATFVGGGFGAALGALLRWAIG